MTNAASNLRAVIGTLAVLITLPAVGDELQTAVERNLLPSTFDVATLDEHSLTIISSASNEHAAYTREQVVDWLNNLKGNTDAREVKDFHIISQDRKGRFASIVYTATMAVASGDKNETVLVTSHEIWERVPSGWHRLFSAAEAKALTTETKKPETTSVRK